jgi:hypothetical protein
MSKLIPKRFQVTVTDLSPGGASLVSPVFELDPHSDPSDVLYVAVDRPQGWTPAPSPLSVEQQVTYLRGMMEQAGLINGETEDHMRFEMMKFARDLSGVLSDAPEFITQEARDAMWRTEAGGEERYPDNSDPASDAALAQEIRESGNPDPLS